MNAVPKEWRKLFKMGPWWCECHFAPTQEGEAKSLVVPVLYYYSRGKKERQKRENLEEKAPLN